MDLNRRQFFKVAGLGLAGSSLGALGMAPAPAFAEQVRHFKLAHTHETRNTCPYCSVGCGLIMYSQGDNAKNVAQSIIHIEGDADHPVNRGTLCPKGASLQQDIVNERRLLKPRVRRPGSDHWEDISWDQAIDEIAQRVRKTRDETFIERDTEGRLVNRCEGIAWNGGCTDTNEFNYLVVKTMRSLGVCYLENQARV